MNFQARIEDNVTANITPLIDVVFLLLIFFMVSTSFEHESELQINLPEASQTGNDADLSSVNLSITSGNMVHLGDASVAVNDTEALRQLLQQAVLDIEEPMIVVNADGETSHQAVVTVMDTAHQLGIYRLSFATQIEQQEDASGTDEP